MQSTFDVSRIYSAQDGWYVIMRALDNKHLTGSKYKFIDNQHLMGPFLNKEKVENWLEDYLAIHSENRHSYDFITADIEISH